LTSIHLGRAIIKNMKKKPPGTPRAMSRLHTLCFAGNYEGFWSIDLKWTEDGNVVGHWKLDVVDLWPASRLNSISVVEQPLFDE
jgi:hypothetical protein